jgi:hypothetical protein
MLFLATLLAAQANIPMTPKEIVVRAVTKSVSDRQDLDKHYLFDVVRTPAAGKPRCKNPNDTKMEIPDLFGPDRYVYKKQDAINLNGRDVYVISFEPKSDHQPETPDGSSTCKTITDKTFNQLQGLIYVDQEDFGIVRVVMHLGDQPVKYYTGRIYQMDVTMNWFRLDTIWAPSEITIHADKSYFWGVGRSQEDISFVFKNYRPKAP